MKSKLGRTLLEYWRCSRRYKISIALSACSVVSATVLNTITPLYFKRFFDILVGPGSRDAIAGQLIGILLVILVLYVTGWFFWRFANFCTSYFQSGVMEDLANRCYDYLQRHSFSFFTDNFVGSLVKKIKWFTNAYEDISDRALWQMLPLLTTIILVVAILLRRNAYLGLGLLAWIVAFMIVNGIFTRYKLKYDLERSAAETKATGFIADTITNHGTVRLFNGLAREVMTFGVLTKQLRRLRMITWNMGNVFEAVQAMFMIVLEIGIFYLAIRLWQRGLLTVGDFVLIQSYLITIFFRVWDFGRIIRGIYERLADAAEMTEVLQAPHEIVDARGARPLRVAESLIEFRNVDFNYHRTRAVLKRFNLTIHPREHLALIGPSGSGKTTVVKLLLRMHDVAGGKILIDGQNIAKITQESLWKNVSLVPQDPILFHRSLMENIRYGKPDATDAEVIAASQAANCHDFITGFADQYETLVGERGVKLSGGERQRVAIARAILRNTPILVLDEATSSLDSESEALIQEALSRLIQGRTVIIIAHRLSTIRKMHRIVVLDSGTIVEEGSHESLNVKETGVYRRLWELQAGGFIR